MDNHCAICGEYLADTSRMICEKCEKPKKAELKPCPYAKEVAISFDIHIDCSDCWMQKCPHPEIKEGWNRRVDGG